MCLIVLHNHFLKVWTDVCSRFYPKSAAFRQRAKSWSAGFIRTEHRSGEAEVSALDFKSAIKSNPCIAAEMTAIGVLS